LAVYITYYQFLSWNKAAVKRFPGRPENKWKDNIIIYLIDWDAVDLFGIGKSVFYETCNKLACPVKCEEFPDWLR